MLRKEIHIITFVARCETALHIGGSQDEIQIGGTDNPVIKNPATGAPYIPGSSLKGKMRGELEKELGRFKSDGNPAGNDYPCGCAREECAVCRVFGAHSTGSQLGPSRILVRDGSLVSGRAIPEIKYETAINRIGGSALSGTLRNSERVPEGARFRMEIVLQVYENDDAFHYTRRYGDKIEYDGGKALQAVVADGLRLVEMTGLGGGISRGSGQVSFHDFKLDGDSEWLFRPNGS